jgi:hypothetical protein
MRKENSLFDKVVAYVNSIPVGSTYKVSDMLDATSPEARNTGRNWWNRDPFYRNRSYQSMLKRCGFIENVKRGEWKVLQNIPHWFSLSDAQKIIGWTGDNEEREILLNNIHIYNKLEKESQVTRMFPNAIMESYDSLIKEMDRHEAAEKTKKKKKKKKVAKMSASYNNLYEKLDNIHHDMVTINNNLRELIEIYK